MRDQPHFINAGNRGPFTLDGTRTYLVGRESVAMIDPGPDMGDHVRALVLAVASATEVRVMLTHGHPDHAAAVGSVVAALEQHPAVAVSVWGPAGIPEVDRVLADGETVETDAGTLVAVHTPGHTHEHLCYHWLDAKALFAGDLLLGEGDTTWVAEYPGCVADYLASLDRLRGLGLSVVYPTHGPPLLDPAEALDRFEAHRLQRISQVREALAGHPGADAARLLDIVYGDALPSAMTGPALQSLGALLDYVQDSDGR